MTVEETVGELVKGQAEFKTSVALLQQGQQQIAKDVNELVVHERQRNNRIEKLETSTVRQSAIMDTMKFIIPTAFVAAGVASGIIFGMIQAVTN